MDEALYRDHADMEEGHWWFEGRRAIVQDLLSQRLPCGASDRRLLDVGCGTGGMLPMLAEFGHVIGLEMSSEAAERARTRAPHAAQVLVGRVPDDLPDAQFDVVSAFDVIEHIEDDLGAVKHLVESLRPGGLLVVTVPAFQWLWSPHDDLNQHKRRYTRARLRRLLSGAHLEVEYTSYFNTWLLPVVAAVRLARKLPQNKGDGGSDFAMPAPRVNRALSKLFQSERRVLRRASFPAGVSIVAICRRPADT